MKDISNEEWYSLLETVHNLENTTNGLVAVVIIGILCIVCWLILSWGLEQDKKLKQKKDKKNDR